MAGIPIKRVTTELDPTFFIPEGVDELVYAEENNLGETYDDYEGDEGDGTNTDDSGRLPAPDTFKIIKQDTYKIKSGQKVVDVVAEVESINGAEKYEIRITKVD